MRLFICLLLAASFAAAEPLRMNHVQVVGTHNSYHLRPDEPYFSSLLQFEPRAAAWDYDHLPLDQQLSNGVRNLELDIFYHPLEEGGPSRFRVYHVPRLDPNSLCETVGACFRTVKQWSDANPNHVPISILLELKEGFRELLTPPATRTIENEDLQRLDEIVTGIFGDSLLTPDDVRGDAATLEQAITTRGWPLLDAVRGKVMVVMHETGRLRDAYVEGHPSARGRPMFVQGVPGRPEAAFLIMNNPHDERIPELVRQGYIIRTRADSELREARDNDTGRREAAKASGAHVVTTDFPPGQAHEDTGYVVQFDDAGRAQRCNPVTAPPGCADEQVE